MYGLFVFVFSFENAIKICCRTNQMIRLTQPELVHDKKQQGSSSPDESSVTVKKEADADPVTSQGGEHVSSGKAVGSLSAISF